MGYWKLFEKECNTARGRSFRLHVRSIPPPSTRYADFSMFFYNAAYTDGAYLVSFGINRVDVNNYESATYTENEPNIRYELDGVSVAMDFICVCYQLFAP